MSVTIRVDESVLRDVQSRLGEIPEKAPNIISASLNRTVTNVASNLSKEIRKIYTVKAGDIKGTVTRFRSTPQTLSASVTSRGGPMGLDKFKTSALMSKSNKGGVKTVKINRKPVKAEVKKGQMKKVLGGFVAEINGPKVFKRQTKHRLPIERLHGPSVPQMAGSPEVGEAVSKEAKIMFDRRIDHEIGRLLARLGGS